MAKQQPRVDAVIVGLGWTGSIMGMELTDAGLNVLALERGADRTNEDFAYPKPADELEYGIRHTMMQKPKQSAVTIRRNLDERALPQRKLGAFLPGDGVGGAGAHWTGVLIRPTPTDLQLKTFADQAFEPGVLQEDMQIQDFGVTWDELEPHFTFFEKVCGQSGTTGNLNGSIKEGGDPFEGPRSEPYPLPALQDTQNTEMFEKAAKQLGYHPFPNPSANVSRAWTNPYGMQLGPCNYCGFCSRYGCLNYSKASPQTCILNALKQRSNFAYRTNANVTRVELAPDGKTATGVTYIDDNGEEIFQPADMVILASYSLNNVRLMLNSGIGQMYDPIARTGTVGRNYAYQIGGGINLYFDDIEFNPFATAGATGKMFNDFSPGNFDSAQYGFIGGAKMHSSQASGTPIKTPLPKNAPKWGQGYKDALQKYYGHHMKLSMTGSVMSYRSNMLDLDPTWKDPYGMPLLRMTFDWKENEHRLSRFMRDRLSEIADILKPDYRDEGFQLEGSHFKVTSYVSTHNVGGAVMGTDPSNSALNRYLQSWDVHNVFVPGGNAFPQNFQANPTDLIGALTYWSAKKIREDYLKNPGPLMSRS
ncbi:GMC family oxidoreductase [Salinicola rhizosphaerae]|uniref:GMC family oxidoreductase n=1 Tax=Salinicola rhizosphaerae TaxID=1443141 RepID=A0ABQ3EGQ4_9GAMM|nr:GMC family oxidoreductase [Salinicola rhizosphaerae]GHB34124.1 GMC family oxidoreductase [Salinicola rhizosphaerae]